MRYNVGNIERVIRILLGTIILAAGFYYESFWGLVAIVPLVSGIVGFCPLYGVFGLSTCSRADKSKRTRI